MVGWFGWLQPSLKVKSLPKCEVNDAGAGAAVDVSVGVGVGDAIKNMRVKTNAAKIH